MAEEKTEMTPSASVAVVRAKFRVTQVLRNGGPDAREGGSVTLYPVVGGSAENDQFYKYTPAGNINLSTINDDALAQFEEGAEFYVDFTPAGEVE